MRKILAGTILAGLTLLCAAPGAAAARNAAEMHAAGMSEPMSAAGMDHARFGGSVYTGQPNLPLTLSLIAAGGGPGNFKTTELVSVLAGDKTQAELASLTQKFGAANVNSFVDVFDFVIADALKIVTAAKVALPSAPSPAPSDGKALATALYNAGIDKSAGSFNVEYLLDGLVTHPVHVQVMKDIDAKFGERADANYHVVLYQAMTDLKSIYGL